MTFVNLRNLFEDNDSEFLLSKADLEFLYDFVKDDVYRSSELRQKIVSDVDFPRGKNSLRLGAIRMHVLVHGMLPLDMEPNPDWYSIPSTMKKFAEEKGIDVSDSIEHAIEDGEKRKNSFEDSKKKIEDALDRAMPNLEAFFQQMISKGFDWLKFSNFEAKIAQEKNMMIAKAEEGRDPVKVVSFHTKRIIEDMLKDRQARQKQRQYRQAAKQREKELKQRRLGSVWKGVSA